MIKSILQKWKLSKWLSLRKTEIKELIIDRIVIEKENKAPFSSYKVFRLGFHGVKWLIANGIDVRKSVHNDNLQLNKIKQTLATNQLIYAIKIHMAITADVKKVIACDIKNKGLIRLATIIQNQNWKEELKERIERYETVITYPKIFIAEDMHHMREISETVKFSAYISKRSLFILDCLIQKSENLAFVTCDFK